MNKILKIGLISGVIVAVMSLFLVPVAQAAIMRGGVETSLQKGQKVEGDLYIGGSEVEVAGEVTGDLIVAGNQVFVNGPIGQDINAVGNLVHILSPVQESVRAAGAEIVINNEVKGDVVAFGSVIKILSGAKINGDLLAKGRKISVSGTVQGSTHLSGAQLRIDGKTKGAILESDHEVEVGPNAVIDGDLTYVAPSINLSEKALVTGQVNAREVAAATQWGGWKHIGRKLLGAFSVFYLLALLFAGILLVKFFSRQSRDLGYHSLGHFGSDFLRGLIILVVFPILALLLFLSLFGGFVALIGTLVFLTLLAVAKVYAGIIFGAWLFKLFSKYHRVIVNWKSALVGIASLYIIGLIPFAGWVINLFFVLVALGGLSYLKWREYREGVRA